MVSEIRACLRAAVAAPPGPPGRHMVPRRAVREDPRPAAVSVACRGRGRRRPRHSRAIAAQSAGGHTVLPQAVEKTRLRASPTDHGQAPQLLGRASYRDAVRDPQYPAVRKQPSRGLASTDPPARAPDAPIQIGRPSATVRIGARRRTESVPGRPTSAPRGSLPSAASALPGHMGPGDVRLLTERGHSAPRERNVLSSAT